MDLKKEEVTGKKERKLPHECCESCECSDCDNCVSESQCREYKFTCNCGCVNTLGTAALILGALGMFFGLDSSIVNCLFVTGVVLSII